MAQVRRPVPFRTRKLRPGTAMVLHSTGCGRVAHRRITRKKSPDTTWYRSFSRMRAHAPGSSPVWRSFSPQAASRPAPLQEGSRKQRRRGGRRGTTPRRLRRQPPPAGGTNTHTTHRAHHTPRARRRYRPDGAETQRATATGPDRHTPDTNNHHGKHPTTKPTNTTTHRTRPTTNSNRRINGADRACIVP